MADKFKIYSIHHKEEQYPAYKNDVVSPILAGTKPDIPRTDISLYDDVGPKEKQIADLHETFGEFTATYWVWKNSNADCIGIMHYRRVLDFSCESVPLGIGFCQDHGLTRSRLDEVFQDIKEYLKQHYQEMLGSFETHFYDRKQRAYFKCQIMAKREVFHEYAKFMFDVLFYLNEKYKDKIKGKAGESRFFAFIGERLMSLYVYHCIQTKKHRVKCFPIRFYGSIADYNRYFDELIETYKITALAGEPSGYLRHLFYHQNVYNPEDRRVSININYRDYVNQEYSGVIVKQGFVKYELNRAQKLSESSYLQIKGKNGEKQKMLIDNCQLKTEGGPQSGAVLYEASGFDGMYHAYMIRWNAANQTKQPYRYTSPPVLSTVPLKLKPYVKLLV